MSTAPTRLAFLLGVLMLMLLQRPAAAQAFTEIRDPLRGVTLYSAQISSDSLTSLQVEGSVFSSGDKMTLGLSAFFFDESDVVDEYVMWLRHDGPRRWFSSTRERPLKLYIDDEIFELATEHATHPDAQSTPGPMVEKKEFSISPDLFQVLLASDDVILELTTSLGVVEKDLNESERAAIARFDEIVRRRHSELTKADLAGGR